MEYEILKKEHTSTVYHCLKVDKKTIPTTKTLAYQANTEQEAIDWLKENGGGLFKNVLHNYEFYVNADI